LADKQGNWFIWDSRGGTRARSKAIQPVNFDLQVNHDEWVRLFGSRVKITGSIESGRMTYEMGTTTCEFWREDMPNPTPYTKVDNPDPIEEGDPARIRSSK
jgi:hypothetical protein